MGSWRQRKSHTVGRTRYTQTISNKGTTLSQSTRNGSVRFTQTLFPNGRTKNTTTISNGNGWTWSDSSTSGVKKYKKIKFKKMKGKGSINDMSSPSLFMVWLFLVLTAFLIFIHD